MRHFKVLNFFGLLKSVNPMADGACGACDYTTYSCDVDKCNGIQNDICDLMDAPCYSMDYCFNIDQSSCASIDECGTDMEVCNPMDALCNTRDICGIDYCNNPPDLCGMQGDICYDSDRIDPPWKPI